MSSSGHDHRRPVSGGQRELALALVATLAMMTVEFSVAWLTGSLALLADAAHMLTDSSALALSLFAAWFAGRPATPEKTYGYYRTEILAALANGIALWLIVIWIYLRAFERLRHPTMVQPGPMILVAIAGLLVNLGIGRLLSSKRAMSLNVQGAWLNVMSDALGSVGVAIAGLLIWSLDWTMADPIASMVIGILIAINSWGLVAQSVNILLEGTPRHLNIGHVVSALKQVSGVEAVHDIHLWTITTGMDAMSGHIVVRDVAQSASLLSRLDQLLSQRFGIRHTTLQLEPSQHACDVGHE